MCVNGRWVTLELECWLEQFNDLYIVPSFGRDNAYLSFKCTCTWETGNSEWRIKLCLSVWEDSEHMGWDLNGVLFYTFFRLCPVYLDIVYSGPSSHCVKFYSFIFMYKNSIGVVCINGKHTDYIKILTGTWYKFFNLIRMYFREHSTLRGALTIIIINWF